MMVAYAVIINTKAEKSTGDVVKKTNASIASCSNKFVSKYKGNSVCTDTIIRILTIVNFEYERKNEINIKNEGFNDFAKEFILFYNELINQDFYNKIIVELTDKGSEKNDTK